MKPLMELLDNIRAAYLETGLDEAEVDDMIDRAKFQIITEGDEVEEQASAMVAGPKAASLINLLNQHSAQIGTAFAVPEPEVWQDELSKASIRVLMLLTQVHVALANDEGPQGDRLDPIDVLKVLLSTELTRDQEALNFRPFEQFVATEFNQVLESAEDDQILKAAIAIVCERSFMAGRMFERHGPNQIKEGA